MRRAIERWLASRKFRGDQALPRRALARPDQEITRRLHAEEALRISLEKYRVLSRIVSLWGSR